MKLKLLLLLTLTAFMAIRNIQSQVIYVPGANGSTPGLGVSSTENIGIGTNSPVYRFDMIVQSVSGDEKLFRTRVNDATNDYFEIANATRANNQFIPYLNGYHESDNRNALYLSGSIPPSMDNGINSVVVFDARYPNGAVQNRPLFSWTAYDVSKMTLAANGNLLLGKTVQTNTNYKLDVAGTIRANEIVVNTTGADFVFEPTYKLRSLAELEAFIKEHKHLPEIVPAKDMQENGIGMGEMQTKMLQTMEELTLYVIELKKENDRLKAEKEKQQLVLTGILNEIEILKKK